MNHKHRLGMAAACLHISTALYALGAAGFAAYAIWGPGDPSSPGVEGVVFGVIAFFCLLLAAVPEIAAWGIRRRRFWGWIMGLVIFGLYVPSLFLPLGAFGLWGLLDAGSRAEFGIGGGGRTTADV